MQCDFSCHTACLPGGWQTISTQKVRKNVLPFQSTRNFLFGSAIHEEYPRFDLCHFNTRNKSFYVFRFFNSRYSFCVERREENSGSYGLRNLPHLTRSTGTQYRRASFVAYFDPHIPEILTLICCSNHLRQGVIEKLENKGVERCADGSSMKDMIPGEDKAFVFLSGRIRPFNEEDVNNIYLR